MNGGSRTATEASTGAAPEAIEAQRETSWEALLCGVFEGLEGQRGSDLNKAAEQVCGTLGANAVLVLESAAGVIRPLASAGASRPDLSGPVLELVRDSQRVGVASNENAWAAAAGTNPAIVVIAQGPRYAGLSPVEQRSVLRCLAAWFAAEHRREVDEEKRAAAIREDKYQSLSHLAVRAGHEFRNTLAAILSHAEFVLDRVDENHIAHQNLEDVVLAARDAAGKVDSLMAFGGLLDRPPPEPVVLHKLIKGMTPVLRALVPEPIQLVVRVEEDCAAGIQPTHLRQMLVNLVTNAADAIGRRNGTISIEVTKGATESDGVKLEVLDDGPGMTEQVARRATDPFFTTRKGSRGLGLPVALGIARGVGGDLTIDSRPGLGTRVAVTLPLRARPPGRIV